MEQRRDSRALTGRQRLVPRREGPAPRPAALADPRLARRPKAPDPRLASAARRAALVLAAVGVLWIGSTALGRSLGWSNRLIALFDLFALAGFGVALYLTWQVWRLRRADRG